MSYNLSKSRICEAIHKCQPLQVGHTVVLGTNEGNRSRIQVACI
jgi:hypothetical protein